MRAMKYFTKFLTLTVAIGVSACGVASFASNGEYSGDLQSRVIKLAYLLHTDPHFYDHPENVQHSFHDVYSVLQTPMENGSSLLAQLGFISEYCRVHLTPGYRCGNRVWATRTSDPNFDGYLFVTDWIEEGNKKFFVMIIGHASPQQTIIARVTEKDSSILYDSFAANDICQIIPPDYSAFDITHYVEVLSPSIFKIIMGSAYPMSHSGVRNATFELKVTASACFLRLLAQKPW